MWKVMAAATVALLGACAHGGEGAGAREEAEAAWDAAAFGRLEAGARLVAGSERVMALRTSVARVRGRIEGLRAAVRERDAAADWSQLVCLEGRVPEVEVFAGRGERAWEAFRGAVLRGEAEAAWTRFELMRLARLGVTQALAEARSCGAARPVAVGRSVSLDAVRVVEAQARLRGEGAGLPEVTEPGLPPLGGPWGP